jgi:hypothetical protein
MQCGAVELAVRDGVRRDERLQADALRHPFHRGDILPLHMHRIHRRCTEGKKKKTDFEQKLVCTVKKG